MAYILDALIAVGITRIVIVVGHGSGHIQTQFGDSYRGVELSYVNQQLHLGSGYALQKAANHVGREFLVVNGDSIIDTHVITQTLERYTSTDSVATVSVAKTDTPEEHGVVITDRRIIANLDEHSPSTKGYIVNAGVYVFTDEVFEALEKTQTRGGQLHLIDSISHLEGNVTSVIVNGGWLNPTTPWRLLDVTETVLRQQEDVVIAESANIHDTVIIEGPAIIGPMCEIGPGVIICGGSCLLANVQVGPGTVIDRSIILNDARLGGSVHLCDSIIGTGSEIRSGTISPGGIAEVNIGGRLFAGRRIGSVVADHASIGPNATLLPGSLIGAHARVGPGVVVDGTVNEGVKILC